MGLGSGRYVVFNDFVRCLADPKGWDQGQPGGDPQGWDQGPVGVILGAGIRGTLKTATDPGRTVKEITVS